MINASAFILIGGMSRRFGSPKWKAVLNNVKLIDQIWEMCHEFENRFVIGKREPKDLSYPFIADTFDIQTPLNGIHTALLNSKQDWSFIISCDLPLIDPLIFNRLEQYITKHRDAVLPIANDKIQVTCGFYNKRIVSKIEMDLVKQRYSILKFVENINTTFVNFYDCKYFWNMNTKRDFKEIDNYCVQQENQKDENCKIKIA